SGINLLRTKRPPYPAIFDHTVRVRAKGQVYHIPSLEMALTYKFATMMDYFADEVPRLQDSHDFIVMVRNNGEIELETLRELGEVIVKGGGKSIVNWVKNIRAGRKLAV